VLASLPLRYFGPRALIEDNSVRSKATTLLHFESISDECLTNGSGTLQEGSRRNTISIRAVCLDSLGAF
jgi:hypothetical protein